MFGKVLSQAMYFEGNNGNAGIHSSVPSGEIF